MVNPNNQAISVPTLLFFSLSNQRIRWLYRLHVSERVCMCMRACICVCIAQSGLSKGYKMIWWACSGFCVSSRDISQPQQSPSVRVNVATQDTPRQTGPKSCCNTRQAWNMWRCLKGRKISVTEYKQNQLICLIKSGAAIFKHCTNWMKRHKS